MFDKLPKHHLGFIVPVDDKGPVEQKTGKKFVYDRIQKTHVLFVYNEDLRIYVEYICQEGRAANQKPGFAHICYDLKSRGEVDRVEAFIKENKVGYPLTEWEKSGSKECGMIKFYFIKDHGIVELNLREDG